MILLEKMREKKKELHLTNAQIAERSCLPLSTVNTYFAGSVKNPSLITAGPLCKVLGISLDGHFGITNSEMEAAEIARIRAEYEENKTDLNKRIAEHAQNLLMNEAAMASDKEIIRRQDGTIADLQDRIRYQRKAIFLLRMGLAFSIILLVALAAYIIWMK